MKTEVRSASTSTVTRQIHYFITANKLVCYKLCVWGCELDLQFKKGTNGGTF